MSFFDKIKHAIFGDKGPMGMFPDKKTTSPTTPMGAPQAAPGATAQSPKPPVAPPAAAAQPVDVAAVLTDLAAKKGKPSNWRVSIVDLLQLLDLDSSLSARKELGQELGVHAGADGSAEQNIALHKAVMKKLSENGGKVPADLKD